MSVLGLDISTKTGWSVVSNSGNLLEFGLIKLKTKDLKSRIDTLSSEIKAILLKHKIDKVVIEAVFHGPNPKTTALLNKLQGAVILSLPDTVEIILVNASSARKQVLGQGTKYSKIDVYNWAVKHHKLKDFIFTKHNDITDSILLSHFGIK
jgi:crossover junction endodeoxyribonuclease RuvC